AAQPAPETVVTPVTASPAAEPVVTSPAAQPTAAPAIVAQVASASEVAAVRVDAPVVAATLPIVTAPAPVASAPELAPELAPAPAPISAAAPIPAAPDSGALQAVVEQAGLQWVQTTSAPAEEPEPVAPVVRTPRVRKPRPAVASEPLVQIETEGDRPAG
ncbi:MAG: ribonuclease E/G, partial [Burkholderiales bacterium]|nr:ribonuclease E/G [Burkholderiales bacterium]